MAAIDWDVGMNSLEFEEFDDEFDDGPVTIYPYPEGWTEPQFDYTYDLLLDFSKKSIQKLSQDTGKEYQFVELVEALMHSSYENDSITAYVKACHPDDGIILTFEATTVCPRDGIEAFSHCNLQDICVSPLPHSASQTPPAQNLEAQVELLKV